MIRLDDTSMLRLINKRIISLWIKEIFRWFEWGFISCSLRGVVTLRFLYWSGLLFRPFCVFFV